MGVCRFTKDIRFDSVVLNAYHRVRKGDLFFADLGSKFDAWFSSVEMMDELIQFLSPMCPDEENVIDVSSVEYGLFGVCVDVFVLKFTHVAAFVPIAVPCI